MEPFATAGDAVIWALRSLDARHSGVHARGAPVPRPCVPDDIMICLDRLYRRRRISTGHAQVLREWANQGVPPSRTDLRDAPERHVWDEAMAELAPLLIRRGIVRRPADSDAQAAQ